MKLRVYIVEDELNSRNLLKHFIEKYGRITVCGEAESYEQAIPEIRALQPDIVFMDISLPDKDGFEILNEIGERNFELIFVTAFEQHALKALKINAVDYLLKPVDISELLIAIEKAGERIRLQNEKSESNRSNGIREERLLIPNGQEILLEPLENIIRLKASGRYSEIFLISQKKYVITKNLGEFEKLPVLQNFIRVHNSHLINPAHIKAFEKSDGGSLLMSDGSRVEVSRRNRDQILSFLHTDNYKRI